MLLRCVETTLTTTFMVIAFSVQQTNDQCGAKYLLIDRIRLGLGEKRQSHRIQLQPLVTDNAERSSAPRDSSLASFSSSSTISDTS